MSTILCLSSQVARGYVGGSAARIALESLGHDCWLLPTVVLSNHPGYERFAGEQVPPGRMRAMLEALDANGWLADVDAVMTGYMPTSEHVGLMVRAVQAVKKANASALYLCDPILGDDPGGLYVDEDVAAAIRDELLPLADIATPNRFEFEWLTGKSAKRPSTAVPLAKSLGPETVIVTSLTGDDTQALVNLLVAENAKSQTVVDKRKHAPHGAGDLMAALYLGHLLSDETPQSALGRATASVEEALEASAKSDELQLAKSPGWRGAEAWAVDEI